VATLSTYCLEGAGGTKIAISRDELRALLVRVEAELQRSDIYHKVVESLQHSIDGAAESSQTLVKALGREAIRLVLRRLVKQYSSHSLSPQDISVDQKVTPISSAVTDQKVTPIRETLQSNQSLAAVQQAERTESSPRSSYLAISPDRNEASSRPVATPFDSTGYSVSTAPVESASTTFEPASERPKSDRSQPQTSPTKTSQRFRRFHKANQPTAETLAERREASLLEIGSRLRQARLGRGISLDQLNYQTRIPTHQLKALEAGLAEQLPEDIYVRGFIRRIGDVLGLNEAELMALLPSPEPNKIIVPSWQRVSQTPTSSHLRPVHLYVGYAALMAGATGGLVWMTQQPMFNGNLEYEFPDLFENPSAQSPLQLDSYGAPKLNQAGSVANPETLSPESQFDANQLFP
jgi:hypothetical protein